MLHSRIYHCVHTLNYPKGNLNVQNELPPTKFDFFAHISYLFENRHSHLGTTGYPEVKIPTKLELTKHKRKQTVS